jgi:hypothetical protein
MSQKGIARKTLNNTAPFIIIPVVSLVVAFRANVKCTVFAGEGADGGGVGFNRHAIERQIMSIIVISTFRAF